MPSMLSVVSDKNFLRFTILGAVAIIAFAARLFAVLRYESVIHEFDPYFNYRSTKFLTSEGYYNFHNWFDDRAWYPLGRIVGGTIYPGLMVTAAAAYWVLNALHVTVNIRNICVFLAPAMAALTTFFTYLFAKEVVRGTKPSAAVARKAESAGLVAAAFIAVVPGYISRSVAGSYDNEGVAIWALITTYWLWVKAVNTGSVAWSMLCTLCYFYMVTAWGGYIFIINLIPLYVVVCLVTGRYSARLHVAYSTVYVLGTLLSMQVQFVGFQPVYSAEHMVAMAVFGLLQLVGFVNWVRTLVSPAILRRLTRLTIIFGVATLVAAYILGSLAGYLTGFTGRFYSLLDPTYAKEHIPIIASVSEHQPTTWSSFFFDLHILTFLTPVGLYFCFKAPNDGKVFVVLYGLTSVYFAGVMVRLMLVLAPIACVLSAIAVTETLMRNAGAVKLGLQSVAESAPVSAAAKGKGKGKKAAKESEEISHQSSVSGLIFIGMAAMLSFYAIHSLWVTSEAYSSPSIVLAARQNDGSRMIFDDFREAYWWLRQNTKDDAKVMSWWDYGYQITSIANRTILVDNNTWNNTHIATVGRAMASTEEDAYPIMRSLDVDYVLVIFGGLTGYSSDDINKFLWMIRIGGGVFPHIQEPDYFTPGGEYKVDSNAPPAMLNSLMYKLCYYRFGAITTEYNQPTGYDRVRQAEIGNKFFELEHLEEAFSSEHWIVRIYKVKKPANRGDVVAVEE